MRAFQAPPTVLVPRPARLGAAMTSTVSCHGNVDSEILRRSRTCAARADGRALIIIATSNENASS
jgi:hypothetical protein